MLQQAVRRNDGCDEKLSRSKTRERIQNTSERSGVRKFIGAAYLREADSFITRDTRDDSTTASFFSSRYDTTVVGSDDAESDSRISDEESEWSKTTTETRNTKNSAYSWVHQSNQKFNAQQRQQHQQQQQQHRNHYHVPNDVSSPTNSVEAVRGKRASAKNEGAKKVVTSFTTSTFDYIRKTRQQFAKPCQDPPSDKSMATSRSIRAADAGSVFFKKKVNLQRRKNELARLILKRNQMEVIQAGKEP